MQVERRNVGTGLTQNYDVSLLIEGLAISEEDTDAFQDAFELLCNHKYIYTGPGVGFISRSITVVPRGNKVAVIISYEGMHSELGTHIPKVIADADAAVEQILSVLRVYETA